MEGVSHRDLVYMRLFYCYYPQTQKSQTLPDKLSWSHGVELLKMEDQL